MAAKGVKQSIEQEPNVFPLTPDVFKKTYEKGSVIFRQGDIENDFYIIAEGMVGIFLVNGMKVTKINQLGPGSLFGEFALLGEKKRSATVKALTNVTVYKVTEKGFNDLLTQLPEWAVSMMKNLVGRIRTLDRNIK